ncbi:MAG: esterase family protein [Lentisphaeria bacterium]|nr:esterase family protein [Lentisphaeria bacterium]
MYLHCNFHSDVLGKACGMNIILPQKVNTQIGMTSSGGRTTYPMLFLLHGLSDDYTIWMRRTSIERYAAQYNLIIVMPDGGRSFYSDMASGAKYWTFLSEELPAILKGFLPVSGKREETFAAGLSMGGYGALKLGLRKPEQFGAVAGMSSVTDVLGFLQRRSKESGDDVEARSYFGTLDAAPETDDLFALAEKTAKLPEAERPKLYQVCGTEDFLYQENIRFRDLLKKLDAFDYIYDEGPGSHSWEFWDCHIQKILRWLPLPENR